MRANVAISVHAAASAVVALAMFAGCQLADLDGFSSGGTPSDSGVSASVDGDASSDGGAEPDARVTVEDAGVNLLTNGDFELGCAGWEESFGFASESDVARTGTRSCKFCMDTNWEATLEQKVKISGDPGDKYVGEIWMRAAAQPEALKSAGLVGSSLRLDTGGDDPAASGPPISSEWSRITTLSSVEGDRSSVSFIFRLQQTGNPADEGNVICVYVDDAVLRPMQ